MIINANTNNNGVYIPIFALGFGLLPGLGGSVPPPLQCGFLGGQGCCGCVITLNVEVSVLLRTYHRLTVELRFLPTLLLNQL